jgi:hypothetical protein
MSTASFGLSVFRQVLTDIVGPDFAQPHPQLLAQGAQ